MIVLDLNNNNTLQNNYNKENLLELNESPFLIQNYEKNKIPLLNTINANNITKIENIIYSHEQKNYNKLYSKLKEKLGIKNDIRKLDFDSSLKKIKAKTFKTIHYCLRACLREDMNIKRLPQSFIVDIRIDTNKNLFDLNISEIYNKYDIDINYANLLNNDLIKPDKMELLKKFLSCKLIDILNLYRKSKQYERDKNKFIRMNKDKNFGIIFDFTIDNYKNYFHSGKGNRKFKKRKFNFKVITSEDLKNINKK